MLTEGCLETYLKKLIGRSDIENALKRLDKLTLEESRMAAAETLKATHAVDERVKGVAVTVGSIDNRVAGVDDRVAGVDERVVGIDERVVGVDERVQRAANDVDEMKRSSSY
jgi:archaellum component FlaC